jgi:hypothetical protein
MIPYSISNGPAKKLNSKVVSSSIKGTWTWFCSIQYYSEDTKIDTLLL